MVTTPLNLNQVRAKCTEDKFGVSASLHVAHWNCSCEAARGSLLLLAPLAAAAAEGGLLLAAGFIIWAISGWVCLSRRIRVISRANAAGSSTSAFASASGLSRTMAMSISPPSLWIIVGRPAWISARIATALFSHTVRSHSSRALCARVSVCGGAFRAAGVPSVLMKRLSGGTGDGKC